MNGYRGLSLILVLASFALALPTAVSAQKYRDDKYTKEADKFLALAMTRAEGPDRTALYQQALDALTEGFEKEADNGQIWYTAGIAYVGLGRYAEADEAFDKAVAIHPESAEEIEAEREAGWMQAFSEGVALMDQQQYLEALAVMEKGEALYPKRPEGLLNMGSMYANIGEYDKAEDAFTRAAAAAQGELFEQLDAETQASWTGYVEMATLNIAQIRGSQGVDAFTAADYDAAAAAFQRAMEVNPYSRDYLLNYVQAKYAKARDLEEEVETDSSKLDANKPVMLALYSSLQQEIPKVRELDPTNENLMLIQVQAVRRGNELMGDTIAAQQGALAILEAAQAMPVEVMEMSILPGDGAATISGKIRNKNLAANAPVTLNVTLIGYKGDEIGTLTVTVNVGDADSVTPFEQDTMITGQVAGWKYEVNAAS